MPQYILLLHEPAALAPEISPEEMQTVIQRYKNWREEMGTKGFMLGGDKLEDGTGRVLKSAGGRIRVTDGPYAETKEVLGGLFRIQADSYDQAVEVARSCPHLEFGPSRSGKSMLSDLMDHLFRHESARMVSTLVRILGPRHLDLAEEVVQDALVRALDLWPFQGVPANPAAWLIQVARNKALDRLRRDSRLECGTEALLQRWQAPPSSESDEVAMLFLCCHPDLTRESQVALALKTVCGFSVAEIARAFLAEEAAIAQRLVRAKRRLRDAVLDGPSAGQLPAVYEILYLLFNEGYSASAGVNPVRADLCDEAIRMARWVTQEPAGCALLALFLLQSARLDARTNEAGELVLLEGQDRALGARAWKRVSAGSTGPAAVRMSRSTTWKRGWPRRTVSSPWIGRKSSRCTISSGGGSRRRWWR